MAENKFQQPETEARCIPMSKLQSVLSGKWKILILWYVSFYQVQRFGQLLRRQRWVWLHSIIDCKTGRKLLPTSVKVYSTLGGTSE